MRIRALLLRAALLAPLAGLALAEPPEPDDDAARARAGVLERRFVPLASILAWIETRYHGHAIEIELDEDDEPPTYEVEWLTPAGQVIEFDFDARSGKLLESDGRGLDEARK